MQAIVPLSIFLLRIRTVLKNQRCHTAHASHHIGEQLRWIETAEQVQRCFTSNARLLIQ